jgi:aryl-alcohol dehydrogenase-like predicted oxidoreductase
MRWTWRCSTPRGSALPCQDEADEGAQRRRQVALAWLPQRSRNILVIPGTSSVAHLRESVAAGALRLDAAALAALNAM